MKKNEPPTTTRKLLDKIAKDEATPVDVSSLGEGKTNPIFIVPTARGTMMIEQSTGKVWFTRLAKVDEKAGLKVYDSKAMVVGEDIVMEMRMKNSMSALFAQQVVDGIEEGYDKLGKPDGGQEDKK